MSDLLHTKQRSSTCHQGIVTKLYISYLNVFHFLKPRLDRHPNNAYQTLKEIIMDTKVPMFESVSRARRKIQEKTKSLRGLTYKERKTSAEVVKDWSLK